MQIQNISITTESSIRKCCFVFWWLLDGSPVQACLWGLGLTRAYQTSAFECAIGFTDKLFPPNCSFPESLIGALNAEIRNFICILYEEESHQEFWLFQVIKFKTDSSLFFLKFYSFFFFLKKTSSFQVWHLTVSKLSHRFQWPCKRHPFPPITPVPKLISHTRCRMRLTKQSLW